MKGSFYGGGVGLLVLTFLRRSVPEGEPYMAVANLLYSDGHLQNNRKVIVYTHMFLRTHRSFHRIRLSFRVWSQHDLRKVRFAEGFVQRR